MAPRRCTLCGENKASGAGTATTPHDDAALAALRRATGRKIEPVLASTGDIRAAIDRYHRTRG